MIRRDLSTYNIPTVVNNLVGSLNALMWGSLAFSQTAAVTYH